MKKILIFISFVFCFLSSFGQFPITQNLGNANTLVQIPANGGLRGGIINRYFNDTTAANLTYLAAYPFAQIGTIDNKVWIRNLTATGWIEIGSSSGDGGIHGVYAGYGLGKTNDSTLYFLPSLRDSIIGLIPAQFNPIAGYNMNITGTYPNKTFTPDSTIDPRHLATQGYVDRKIDSLDKSIIGDVVSTTFPGVSIPSGFTQLTGAATISYNNGVTLSGGNGNYSNNYVKSTFNSYSNNASFSMNFTVNTKPASETEGLILSKIAVNNLYVAFKRNGTDSARLTMRVVSGSGNGTIFDSTASVAMANGNTYNVLVSISNNSIFFKLALVVAGKETQTASKLYRIATLNYIQLPTVGNVGIGVLGGNYTVTSLKQTDYDVVNSDVLILGTSITQTYLSNSFNNHYLSNSLQGTGKSYVNFGSSTNDFSQVITAGLAEIYLAQPKVVGIEMGVNDVCANIRVAASQVIDSLQAHGIEVFWIQAFTSSCKDTVIQNICNEQGIPLYAPGKSMTSNMFVDGVHPNELGFLYMASFLKGNAPHYFGNTGGIDGYSLTGLKGVTISSPSNGEILTYNSTTGQWSNASPNSNFIQNQNASAQSANYWISGTGIIGGSLLVGASSGIGSQLLVSQNTAGGNSIVSQNLNASGGAANTFQFTQMGSSGFGLPDWANAGVIEGAAGGGVTIDAYSGDLSLQRARVTKLKISSNGVAIATSSAGTANASAALDISTTTQGFLPPRMTGTQMNAISSPATGLVVYNTDSSAVCYYNGSAWLKIGSSGGGGTVTSVSGTTNRITSTGGTTPVIDISASYVGQSSITTLGTVTTGTLSTGSVIGGVTMTLGSDATGDIYYRNGSGILTRLPIGTSRQKLSVVSGLPSWVDSTSVGQSIHDSLNSNTFTIGIVKKANFDSIAINTATNYLQLKALQIVKDGSPIVPTVTDTTISWSFTTTGGSLTVGSTAISSGTNTRILYNNSGTLGEYAISGTGNVAMTTSPSFTTPTLGVATATSINGFAIQNAAADGSTKGLAAFNATNFTASSGVINTIQDITTTSTPQFGGMTISPGGGISTGILVSGTTLATGLSVGTTVTPITANGTLSVLDINGTMTEYSSGTHPLLAGVRVRTPTITSGAATVTNAASLYIEGAPSGTFTNTAMALYVASGLSKFGGDVDFSSNAVYGNSISQNSQSGTTYTLLSSDNGKVIMFTNGSAVTVTVPSGLPTGFNCTIIQQGAGQVSLSPSSTTLHNSSTQTKTRAQYSTISIIWESSNTYIVSGDTGT